MRVPFLSRPDGPFGGPGQDLLVVHGHTIEYTVRGDGRGGRWRGPFDALHAWQDRRLGLDAGSFESSAVAAAQFEDGRYRLFGAAIPAAAAARGVIFPPPPPS